MYRIERGDTIQIFVDADACPVIHIVETIAKKHKINNIALIFLADFLFI